MSGIRICLKKSRISRILVAFIFPLVLLLSFLGSSRKVYALGNIVEVPSAFVTPNGEFVEEDVVAYTFNVSVFGNYEYFDWQYANGLGDDPSWHTASGFRNSYSYYLDNLTQASNHKQIRVVLYYYADNQLVTAFSNVAYIYNGNLNSAPQIVKFTDFASTLLDSFLEWFNISLDFMLDNPIVFVGLAMVLIVIVIGTLRHLIGGSNEKEICSI